MKLLDGVEHSLANGWYVLTWNIGTGSGKLQYSVDGFPFEDVPNSLRTATDSQSLPLPDCKIKAVLTGDALMSIGIVKRLK